MDDEVREGQGPVQAAKTAARGESYDQVSRARDWREADIHNHQLKAAIRELQARMTRVEAAMTRIAQQAE